MNEGREMEVHLSLEAHRKFAKISYTEKEWGEKSFANVVSRLWNKSCNLDARREWSQEFTDLPSSCNLISKTLSSFDSLKIGSIWMNIEKWFKNYSGT